MLCNHQGQTKKQHHWQGGRVTPMLPYVAQRAMRTSRSEAVVNAGSCLCFAEALDNVVPSNTVHLNGNGLSSDESKIYDARKICPECK